MKKVKFKKRKLLKLTFSLGSLATLGFTAVACDTVAPNPKPDPGGSPLIPLSPAQGVGTWTSQMKNFTTFREFNWNAENSRNLDQMMTVMNQQMGNNLFFTPEITKMKPAQLVEYLLRFYNSTNGGNYYFNIHFKGQTSKIKVSIRPSLRDVISSFDQAFPPITDKTPKSNLQSPINLTTSLAIKMGGAGNIAKFINMFQGYSKDIFDASPLQLFSFLILRTMPTKPNLWQIRTLQILQLLDVLPSASIQQFPNILQNYLSLANQVKNNKVTKAWAEANNIDLTHLDHFMIYRVMHKET